MAPTYDPSNIFAKILRGEMPAHKVYEDADTLAFLDIMPRASFCAVMKAFSADGVSVQQFNEPAGGQVVFHLHVHVMPRFEGVALKPPAGPMEKPEVLATNADKIRAALAS